MTYKLQWLPGGVVKHFNGAITFDHIIKSELTIAGSSHFTDLRYVISNYMNAHGVSLTEIQRQEIRAQRIGGYFSNPRIRYAFATHDHSIKSAIEQSVIEGHTLHPTRVFPTFDDAYAWVKGELHL